MKETTSIEKQITFNYYISNIERILNIIKTNPRTVVLSAYNSYVIKEAIGVETYYYQLDDKDYGLNKNLKIEEIITQVNIGLDKPFYEEAKKIKVAQTKYVLVNKYNYLDKEYTPDNLVNLGRIRLVKCAADAFTELVNAAKEEDYYIRGVSGYRSYNYQDSLYNKYVTSDGKENADRYSARAGYSEHQTGLALDISNNKSTYMDFESTKEFEWMKNNAHKYGFILRYPKDKEKITGYMYEAWHYRFVGTEIATYIKKHNITYDEYYTMFIDL